MVGSVSQTIIYGPLFSDTLFMETITNSKLAPEHVDWPVHLGKSIELANNVINTNPNPRVGCVIVSRKGETAEGWHEKPGLAHAEIMALQDAESKQVDIKGATAFVSLEPCAHKGRTGPCAEALVAAKIDKVVIAAIDPNPKVAGKGVAILESAGISVFHLVDFELRARAVNPGFFKRFETGLPFVRLKLAMSLDGRTALANGLSQWITGTEARADVQRLRASSSAVITGIGSVLNDDPSMNVRVNEINLSDAEVELNKLSMDRQPLRVIIDSKLRTPGTAKIFGPGRVKIFTLAEKAAAEAYRQSAQLADDVDVIQCSNDPTTTEKGVDLRSVLESLAQFECNDVLVEAGATLSAAFIQAGLVDEVLVYLAPKLLGADAKPLFTLTGLTNMGDVPEFTTKSVTQLGQDIRITLSV